MCGRCGSVLRAVVGLHYRCKAHGCTGMKIGDLDMWVGGLVVARLCEDVISAFMNADDSAAEAARAEEERLRRKLDEAALDCARNVISNRALGIIERELEPLIDAATKRAKELALPSALRAFSGVIGQMAAVFGLWQTTPLAAKRDIVRALAERVELRLRSAGPSPKDRVRVT